MGKLAFIVKQQGENLTIEDMAALDAAHIELDSWLGSEDVEGSRSFSYTLRYFLLFLEVNGTDFDKVRDPPRESKSNVVRQMHRNFCHAIRCFLTLREVTVMGKARLA